jgi:nicotinamidase-related amidase
MPETYDLSRTVVLLVDHYNDFLSEGGKIWPAVKPVAEQVGLLGNMRSLIGAARQSGTSVIFVPHRQWEPGDYETWDHPNRSQHAVAGMQAFARGTWGGEFHPDFQPQAGEVVTSEHWAQSGFANTDLDFQLKQHGKTHVMLTGLLANTCIESTGRFAMELGYHVTLIRDATAAFSPEMMTAAHELNGPTFAHEILTTAEILTALKAQG